MLDSAEDFEHATSGVQLAAAAVLFGAALAAIDGCVLMVAHNISNSDEIAWLVVQGWGTLCVVSAVAFFAASLALRLLSRWISRAVLPMTAGWALSLILLDAFIVVGNISRPSAWAADDVMLAGVMVLLAGLVGVLAYSAASHSSPLVMTAYAVRFTACSLITFVFIWIQLFWIHGLDSTASFVLTAVCVTSILAVLLLAGRASRGMLYLVAIAPLTLAAVAAGSMFLPEKYEQDDGGKKISKIFLITIDTLRSDYLSAYNPKARPTPHLDRLAAEGILFRNSHSLSPWTLPSMASVMTGLPPRFHGANRETFLLDDSMVTLAEHLKAHAYRTAAIGLNPNIAFTNFAQGFDRFQFYPPQRLPHSVASVLLKATFPKRYNDEPSTTELTDLAIDWSRHNRSHDFFLWLHYLDPHVPYRLPLDRRPNNALAQQLVQSVDLANNVRSGRVVLTDEERDIIKDLYAREVQYVDDEVGRLIEVLEELGIYQNSLIAVTSDHGEELWDHGGYEHGHSLREELLRVPLFLRGPGLRPAVRDELVGNHQLMSTILSLAGIENQDEWESQTPSLLQAADKRDQVLFAGSNLYYADQDAVLWNDSKCIDTIESGRKELYDLADEPLTDQDQMKACGQLLGHHLGRADKAVAYYGLQPDAAQEFDEAAQKQLRSLGYVQ